MWAPGSLVSDWFRSSELVLPGLAIVRVMLSDRVDASNRRPTRGCDLVLRSRYEGLRGYGWLVMSSSWSRVRKRRWLRALISQQPSSAGDEQTSSERGVRESKRASERGTKQRVGVGRWRGRQLGTTDRVRVA